MPTFWNRIMNGITAFRQGYLYPDNEESFSSDWGDWEARQMRYAVYQAFSDNSIYTDSVNRWSKKMKADFGLYRHTRGIYNPVNRLVNFYESYIWGGTLDPLAGNEGALPIVTDNDNLRVAIAQLWQWSNWRINRSMVPRQGALLGDVFLRVVDNPERGTVYLKQIRPSTVKDLVVDDSGNIKAYVIEYSRQDDASDRDVVFTETAERNGDSVVYSLYKDGSLHAWDDSVASQWELPYGFIPMVHIQHQNTNQSWGVSEIAPRLQAFMEVDDQASKLNDQIRKAVDPPWLMAGVNPPAETPTAPYTAATAVNPHKSREQTPFLYAPAGATPHALLADVKIGEVSENIQNILSGLENDYPELALHRIRSAASSDISGRAVRLLRGEAETKAAQKRDIYDDGLIRAQQMAVAIGGWRGYDSFRGFNLESYKKGDLVHHIGKRPVFAQDPIDVEEIEHSRLLNLQAAVAAGFPLDVYMRKQNYSDELIQEVISSPEYQARLAMMQMGLDVGEDG